MILPKVPENETPVQRISRKAWTTRGARLEAARRLERMGQASGWVILLSSLVLVSLSLFLALAGTGVPDPVRVLAEGGLVAASMTVLAVGLVEKGKSYELRADRHHRVALALNRLIDQIRAAENSDASTVTDQYHVILSQFPENHETVDHWFHALQYPNDFSSSIVDRVRVPVIWHLMANSPWLILAALAAVILRVSP